MIEVIFNVCELAFKIFFELRLLFGKKKTMELRFKKNHIW